MARPREFDPEEVTESAMRLFWAQGYRATSLSELVGATGLNRSSIYNAFGDKEGLLRATVSRYRQGPARQVLDPLEFYEGLAALEAFFAALATFLEEVAGRGCLMVNLSLEAAALQPNSRLPLQEHFAAVRENLRRHYRQALADGALRVTWPEQAATDWLFNTVRGCLTGAAAGEPPENLHHSLDLTLRVLRG